MRRSWYRTTVENSVTNGARQTMRLTCVYVYVKCAYTRTPHAVGWKRDADQTEAYVVEDTSAGIART